MTRKSACNAGAAGDLGSILGSGRSLGGGHGDPLQHSCLENPMDRGAWWATVHGSQRVRYDLSDWTATNDWEGGMPSTRPQDHESRRAEQSFPLSLWFHSSSLGLQSLQLHQPSWWPAGPAPYSLLPYVWERFSSSEECTLSWRCIWKVERQLFTYIC